MDPGAPSYIERSADARLLDALLAGEYVFVLDSRQKGKSSLVARTLVKLKEHGVQTVKLDLQRIGANVTPEQWYAGLLAGIGQELGCTPRLFEHWAAHQTLGPLARWLAAIETVALPDLEHPLVIFVDEVDFVRALPFPTDEFFGGIRDCYNRRTNDPNFTRLTFCLVGVATPSQLVRNPEITPFNIGLRLELSDFTREETQGYAAALNAPNRDGQALLERVHHWVNGHPYLTQLLCSHLAGNPAITNSKGVDALVQTLFLAPEARSQEPNFIDVERHLLEPDVPGMTPEERKTQVLELYGRMLKGRPVEGQEENPIFATLRLSGVGLDERGQLRVRNRTYRHVFDEQWRRKRLPDAEVRRQRGAARIAVLRTAVVAAILLGIASVVGENFRRLAQSAELQRDRALAEAYQSGMTACTQFEEDRFWPGILQTVESLRDNPQRGWEWDYWNRYARSKTLADDDGTVMDWRWSMDGKSVIGRAPESIRWYDPATGKLRRSAPAEYVGQASTRELPDGSLLDIRWDGTVVRLDGRSGRELWRVTGLPYYWRANSTLSSNGRFLAGQDIGDLWVLDTSSRAVLHPEPPPGAFYFRPSFGSGGTAMATIVSYSDPETRHDVAVIATDTWKVKTLLRIGTPVSSVALSPMGDDLAIGDNLGQLRIYSLEQRRFLFDQRLSERPIWRMDLSPDGRLLEVGLLTGEVCLFRKQGGSWVSAGTLVGALDVAFAPNSRHLLASNRRGQVLTLDDLSSDVVQLPGKDLHILPRRRELVAFAKDGPSEVYAIGPKDLTKARTLPGVASLNGTGRLTHYSVQVGGHTVARSLVDGSMFATLAPTIRYIAMVSDSLGRVLVSRYREPFIEVVGKQQEALSLKLGFDGSGIFVSEDGARVVVTGTRGELGLLDAAALKLRVVTFPHSTAHYGSFSEDSSKLVVAFSDGTVRLVDWATGRLITLFEGHPGMALAAVLSPDGSRVASSSDDNTIRLWNARTGRLLSVLRGHRAGVTQVEFIDDGATLVSVDSAGEFRRWRTR